MVEMDFSVVFEVRDKILPMYFFTMLIADSS